MSKDYTDIGYDKNLNRGSSDSIESGNVDIGYTDYGTNPSTSGSQGSQESIDTAFDLPENVIIGDSIDDAWITNFIKSKNYKPGVNGFMIDGISGDVEFGKGKFRGDITGASGTFSGTITATTGSIGGWTISPTAIYKDGATDAESAGMAPADYPFYAGKKYADRATAPARITPAGVAHFSSISLDTDVVLSGLQAGSSLAIQYLTAGSITSKAITLTTDSSDCYIASGKTDFTNDDAGFILGRDYDGATNPAKFYIGDSSTYMNWTGSDFNLYGATLTSGMMQTGTSGARFIFNYNDSTIDWGITSFDSNNNKCHNFWPDGRMKSVNYTSSDVVTLHSRDYNNVNSSPSLMVLRDQAIISDGGTQTHNGYNFGVSSYPPLILGNSTFSGTGTLEMQRGIMINLEINQLIADGDEGGSDFGGRNYGTSAINWIIEIDGDGATNTYKWSIDGGSTWEDTNVPVNKGPNPGASEFSSNDTIYTADGSSALFYFKELTGGVIGDRWTFTSGGYSSASGQVGLFYQYQTNNTGPIIALGQASATSTNFYKMMSLDTAAGPGIIFWVSDGTTPNGNLSGTQGDICTNCDGGKMYYCTGTTNWTAM